MALTLTTRPSTWSAAKNPVVYKFVTTSGPFVNYRIEVEVFRSSDNTSLTDGEKFSFSPNLNNDTYVDVSSIIKAYLKAEWTKPAALNEIDSNAFIKCYIKYQELYDGSATSVVDDVANPIYAVFGGLQIPSVNGNNLTDYVPADDTKKFLTIFDRPKIWRGYPASLSFIFPNALALVVHNSQYNAAGQIIGSENTEVLYTANDDSVNRLDLTRLATLNDSANTLDVHFEIAGTQYTDQITFDVESPCANPVMLVWKNSLGGDSFWLFEHDQEISYQLSGSKKAKRMVLSANNLTTDQWEALNELNHLGEIYKENIVQLTGSVNKSHVRDGSQVYVVDTDGNKTGVIVIATNNAMFTKMKRHSFKIEIEFPERYE